MVSIQIPERDMALVFLHPWFRNLYLAWLPQKLKLKCYQVQVRVMSKSLFLEYILII